MRINGILIDVSSNPGKVKQVEIDNENLNGFYDMLNCRCIDITTRKIGERRFDIVCDDEGLLKDEPVVSAVDKKKNPMLVGNLFICNHYKGDLTSLSKDDVDYIYGHLAIIVYKKFAEKEMYTNYTLTDVEYA